VVLLCAAAAALLVFPAGHAGAVGSAISSCPEIRVLIGEGASIEASVHAGSSLTDARGKVLLTLREEGVVVFGRSPDGLRAAVRGGATFISEMFELGPGDRDGGWFRVGQARYRGRLRVIGGPYGVSAVNVLPLEEYLYGVVPCEMPPGWPAEALKAQAVAARSFALSCALTAMAGGEPYDITSSTDGQIYGGLDREDPRSNAAVDSTKGMVLTYSGQPIKAFYHSSSAGHTENSEFVWSSALPYLRGVTDPDDDSPYRSWEYRATRDQMTEAFKAAGIDIGEFLGVTGTERGVSGRWSRLVVKGSRGEFPLRGTEFRRIVGLRSTLFDVAEEGGSAEDVLSYRRVTGTWALCGDGAVRQVTAAHRDAEAAVLSSRSLPATYCFRGGGNGHGVGLSQWGARGLALLGHKYPAILQHYYLNTRLERYEWSPPL
jgi:stage II sporulation protein D